MSINVSKVLDFGLFTQCHDRLNKIGKMTFENVSKTDEKTRQFLREKSPIRLKELAQLNCYAADKIKRELDIKYGENNYILIAIGRSISSIVELMGNMGVDTKIIPLTGLRRREVDSITPDNLRVYKSFLAQIGLSKKDLSKNKDKKYILMDYTYYGRTLKRTEQLLKLNNMLGEADNLITIPISDVLGEDYKKMEYDRLFEFCRFKDYSYVGKLHVDNLKDVFKKCKPERVEEFRGNITQGLRKLFWFNVFDILKENNYGQFKPKAEIHALFVHRLSPKAVNNYLNRLFKKNTREIDCIRKQ